MLLPDDVGERVWAIAAVECGAHSPALYRLGVTYACGQVFTPLAGLRMLGGMSEPADRLAHIDQSHPTAGDEPLTRPGPDPASEAWADVDAYLERTVVRPDSDAVKVQQNAEAAGLPRIEVSSGQGKLLGLLAEISGARRVLEVGTLGGFSTLWMARAVGEAGRVITCEYESKHAETARGSLEAAGLGGRVEVRIGAAEDTLAELIEEGVEPFDLVFLDADKRSNARYLELALRMARPGTVIIGDNVVRAGAVLAQGSEDPDVQGIRRFLADQGENPRLEATAVQTVGAKGWDGFSLAVVR